MVDEIRFSFKVYDGLMVCIGITGYFVENAFVYPWTVNVLAHGVADFFWKFRRE